MLTPIELESAAALSNLPAAQNTQLGTQPVAVARVHASHKIGVPSAWCPRLGVTFGD
jgi:hypothetical protein